MTPPRPPEPDVLRPTEGQATEAWAGRVRADRAQVERCREIEDPADFYAPHAKRFAQDPRRTDDKALDVLRAIAGPEEAWLDLGAGGGRYALPLALEVRQVHAVEPSPAMLEVLRTGMVEYAIDNITIIEGRWPLEHASAPRGDAVLMAHVGYDIEQFGAFLDAAEAAASRRCVVVMRAAANRTPAQLLWQDIHGEERAPLPMLQELTALLMARGVVPEIMLAERAAWGYESFDELLDGARRQLWLRPGSAKEQKLRGLLRERASERDGMWAIEWGATPDGIVTWEPRDSSGDPS